MKFSDLNLTGPLLKALDEMGLHTPTTIQQQAFAPIMSGRDVCGIAQTGTGKTFAYLLPCLRQIEFSKDRFPQMLVLVPTRELVQQVVAAARQLSAYRSLEIVGVYGGVNMKPQAEAMLNGLDVLVATPGRLYDLVLNGSLKTKSVKKLVIDEVDEMLDLGFRTQLRNILDLLPERRQNLMFSATLGGDVEQLMDTYFRDPIRIEAAPAGTPVAQIQQLAYPVPNFCTKVNLMRHLLDTRTDMDRVLVFTATKHLADQLYERMAAHYPDRVGVIHSNKEQNKRFETVKLFKEGTYRFIIATDIVARGIDIASVSHVINFDLPEVPENYIHRIGRTGRADRPGEAISFVLPADRAAVLSIEQLMARQLPMVPFPDEVAISAELTEDEQPKVFHKEVAIKQPKFENAGPAFHQKKAKNMKTNQKVGHKQKMMDKYGKPKTRGAKKKR
ncbi:MAG: DEAD/DEAH box helicase [Edaphocola sp.]